MRLLTLLAAGVLAAQSPLPPVETVSEPEFADVFFGVDGGKLIPLERQNSVVRAKVSGFIAMSGKGVMSFNGPFSPVRLHGTQIAFAVRPPASASETDPIELYHLRKLSVGRHSRELVVSTVRISPIGASSDANEHFSKLTLSHYGQFSYKALAVLEPGEYAIGRAGGRTVFCFGVD